MNIPPKYYLCRNEMDWDKFLYFYPVDKNINQFAAWYNFNKFDNKFEISQIFPIFDNEPFLGSETVVKLKSFAKRTPMDVW